MAVLAFAVELDGETLEVTIDATLDPQRFTLKELVRIEEVIGTDATAAWTAGMAPITPRLLQAAIWTKLVSEAPGLPLDAVDLPEGLFGVSNETADDG